MIKTNNHVSTNSYVFDLDHKEFLIEIDAKRGLELYVDGCLRKRDSSTDNVLYVWTNIELLWEEHKFVEARYYRNSDDLRVTVNRSPVTPREIA
ncbi:MAG: hypothetical protein OXC80_08030 [Gammaproteobacteria bacterium]|nr:hypothetical protein [Gammaproteobacteria bacterium]